MQVLIIGAGPCGLRSAIEAQLLGAKVVVVEKRDRFSRNNVLHLWPFVISDLKQLGAKKFYGKFCAGAIDHISKYDSTLYHKTVCLIPSDLLISPYLYSCFVIFTCLFGFKVLHIFCKSSLIRKTC